MPLLIATQHRVSQRRPWPAGGAAGWPAAMPPPHPTRDKNELDLASD
jgi:hypothetical protein